MTSAAIALFFAGLFCVVSPASLTDRLACDRVGLMKRCLFACAIAFLFAACESTSTPKEEKKPEEEKKETVYYIGSIYKVYPDSKFALVRIVKQKPAAGTTLIAHPAAGPHVRMANLQVSNETIDNNITPLIAADIRSGQLEVGDAVYIYRALGEAPPPFAAGADGTPAGATPAGTAPTGAAAPMGVTTLPDSGSVTPPFATENRSHAGNAANTGTLPPISLDPTTPAASSEGMGNTAAPALVPTAPPANRPESIHDTPEKVPSRIKDIPRNFSDWENM